MRRWSITALAFVVLAHIVSVLWHVEARWVGAATLVVVVSIFLVQRTEQARRLREVAASETRLADTLRWSLDAVVAFDDQGALTFFNAAAERTYGCRADEVIGQPVWMLQPVEYREAQRTALSSYMAAPVQSIEFGTDAPSFGLRTNGERFPMEGVITMSQAGNQRLFTCIIRDVTEKVRSQREREESLALLRATLESTADGILVVGVDGRTMAFNRRFVDMWAIPPELTAQADDEACLIIALQRVRDPQAFEARVRALYADPYTESYDLIEMVDGRMVERVSRPQRVGDHVVGRVWNFRDVTARELSAASLRRSEASARAFVERSPFGICRVTPDGLFMSANPALVSMLGFKSEEALLRVDLGTLYVDSSDRAGIMQRHEAGDDATVAETRWRRPDGVELPIRISSQLVRDTRGKCVHYLAYIENLAPLRAAEQALRQSEKLAAVGQFVSGVAHELNNPLAAMLLFTESLLEEPSLEHERDTLTLVRDQACRAQAIVRDLLSFVRGGHGVAATLAAHEVVTHAVRSLERQAQATGGRVELIADAHLGWVHADRGAIEQVLTNLVVNALYAAPGRPVRVRAFRDTAASQVRVVVEDEGPGIPSDVLPRIFEPFYTTKSVGAGTGLGLSVSLGIAERHGGTLRAENRAGVGARFTLSLPLVSPGATSLTPENGSALRESDAGRARRVLIVDDEAPIRLALGRFFERRSWQVDEASDGGEALARLLGGRDALDRHYDLIISDLRMPGVSGVALHDRLAAERPELLARLVVSTGDVVSPEAAEFVARTTCAVIQKPFRFAALDALVNQMTPAHEMAPEPVCIAAAA